MLAPWTNHFSTTQYLNLLGDPVSSLFLINTYLYGITCQASGILVHGTSCHTLCLASEFISSVILFSHCGASYLFRISWYILGSSISHSTNLSQTLPQILPPLHYLVVHPEKINSVFYMFLFDSRMQATTRCIIDYVRAPVNISCVRRRYAVWPVRLMPENSALWWGQYKDRCSRVREGCVVRQHNRRM
jgi:hypothetical protein